VKLGEVTRLVSAPEGAPEGIQNLWFLALRHPETEMGVETERAFIEWHDKQVALAEEAEQLLAVLYSSVPVETVDGIPVSFPGWFGKPWAETLLMSWSAGLENAISEAKAWLVENVEAISAQTESP